MDSVRFSIIEQDLQWSNENLNDVDNDDKKSISSEASCEGVIHFESPHMHNTIHRHDQDIWQAIEIQHTLKQLPNAELITNLIESNNFSGISPNSKDANTALMLAVWQGRYDCVIIALNTFFADVNTEDKQGRTPLHLSCSIGNTYITRILLDYGANPNKWDRNLKATPLHCAASSESVDCITVLLKRGALINAGIEKRSPLHFAVEKNALKCVELLLDNGANPNTPQVYTETPLHVAAALGHIESMEMLLKYGADVRSQYGKKRLTALHLAAEEDYVACVRLLLENKAQIDAVNADNQTALHLACLAQSTESIEVLIKHGANVNAVYKDGRNALHACLVKERKCFECAKLIINGGVDINKPDHYGYTALHLAALNEYSRCAYMLIENGADITARTNGGVSALSFIVRRTPDVIPKFFSKFDSAINVNENEIGDVDCEIKLDFRLLVPSAERGETELLLAFIEVGQKRILNHPLCETFLFLKWRRIRKFFLFSLLYHSIYVMMFTFYILGVYDNRCDLAANKPELCKVNKYVAPVGFIVLILNSLLLLKELFQMGHGITGYAKYWENWLEWATIIGVFLSATPAGLTNGDLKTVPIWQYHTAAIIIFLVWLELMMLVGRFPIFGLYVQMFTKVAVNFSKFLLAYCCLLIAFGLSFAILFNNYRSFIDVAGALFKTIVMMSGELEYEDIFFAEGDEKPKYAITSHILFVIFVILVTVILMNLLVGLAVSDIQGLQASAGLDRLTRQAELVSRLESLFFSKLLSNAPPRIIRMCQRSALLRTSQWQLQYCVRPNDPRETRLPKDLILNIYKLVAERRERDQNIHRKRCEQNWRMFEYAALSQQGTLARKGRKGSSVNLGGNSNNFLNVPSLLSQTSANRSSQRENKDIDSSEVNIENIKLQLVDLGRRITNAHENISQKLNEISNELAVLKKKLPNE